MLSSCPRLLPHVLVLSCLPLTRRLLLFPLHHMKPLVLFVLGGPGAGKGTQCACIVEKYAPPSEPSAVGGKKIVPL
uniref:Adenylate kinase n=1 Tax=Mus spicilegus TaxID=10103 RepID=A0A8C6IH81_MUSSI